MDATRHVYCATKPPTDATQELNERDDMIFITIQEDPYQIDSATLPSDKA